MLLSKDVLLQRKQYVPVNTEKFTRHKGIIGQYSTM